MSSGTSPIYDEGKGERLRLRVNQRAIRVRLIGASNTSKWGSGLYHKN